MGRNITYVYYSYNLSWIKGLICKLMLRSYCWILDSIGTVSQVGSLLERPGMVSIQNSCWHISSKSYKLVTSPMKRYRTVASNAKTSEATVAAKSDSEFHSFVLFHCHGVNRLIPRLVVSGPVLLEINSDSIKWWIFIVTWNLIWIFSEHI